MNMSPKLTVVPLIQIIDAILYITSMRFLIDNLRNLYKSIRDTYQQIFLKCIRANKR